MTLHGKGQEESVGDEVESMVLSRKEQGHNVFIDGQEEAVWLVDMNHRKCAYQEMWTPR